MPKVIPFGDRLLVKRRKVGKKAGSIFLPDETSERATDLADVVYVPEHTFADQELIDKAETIIKNLTQAAQGGSWDAVESLLKFNAYLKIKSIKVEDTVMISKYVGTDFHESGSPDTLTLVDGTDIIGVIV